MNPIQIEQRLNSFWSSLSRRAKNKNQKRPLYASDVNGSLFSDQLKSWNINQFQSHESEFHKRVTTEKMDGIHSSYLYIGTRDTTFQWHVEDGHLNSVSYLHYGAPKVWLTVKEEDLPRFETLCDVYLEGSNYDGCDQPLRHKTIFLSRELLEKARFVVTEVCIFIYIILSLF